MVPSSSSSFFFFLSYRENLSSNEKSELQVQKIILVDLGEGSQYETKELTLPEYRHAQIVGLVSLKAFDQYMKKANLWRSS
jgi:hypothetical protein